MMVFKIAGLHFLQRSGSERNKSFLLFARFLPSPFPALFNPLTSPFQASKKDLKYFRTLSPYSSLFLPASFWGIVRRFWLGGNQFLSSSHLKPTENPRKTSNFSIGGVKKLAGNVVIVAICAEETRSPNNVIWRKSIRFKPFISVIVPIAPRFSSVQTRYENAYIFFFVSPKIDRKSLKNRQFSVCPFSSSLFPALFYPLTSPFYASKKDLKHLRTLSPYSALFLPASFWGIFRRFWLGGDQFPLSFSRVFSSSINVLMSLNWR